MIKLIIFDLDDTLIDSFETNFKAYEKACGLENIRITREDYLKTRGMAWQDSIPLFAKTSDAEKIRRIHENKKGFFDEFATYSKKIAPNIALKNLLREKYELCIATSGSKKNAEALLKCHDLFGDFKFVLTIEDVPRGKPAPDLFLKCAKLSNLKPEECFVIDDSISGIDAAKKAGMNYYQVSSK